MGSDLGIFTEPRLRGRACRTGHSLIFTAAVAEMYNCNFKPLKLFRSEFFDMLICPFYSLINVLELEKSPNFV